MSIYCLSSLGLVESCHYKIGKTTKTQIELENQYMRYLPSVKTYRFEKVDNVNKTEKQIHDLLAKYRVGTSEWFKCDLQIITKTINNLIKPKDTLELEKEKIEVEKKKLELEKQKLEQEKLKLELDRKKMNSESRKIEVEFLNSKPKEKKVIRHVKKASRQSRENDPFMCIIK